MLKELLGPEEAYMFAPFLTGSVKLRVDATMMLFRKYLDDPMNPYRRDLLEFKFKNQLITPEEMEAVMEMNKQMTEKDRVKVEALFENRPVDRVFAGRFSAKVAAEATNEVKLETARSALPGGIDVMSCYCLNFLLLKFLEI